MRQLAHALDRQSTWNVCEHPYLVDSLTSVDDRREHNAPAAHGLSKLAAQDARGPQKNLPSKLVTDGIIVLIEHIMHQTSAHLATVLPAFEVLMNVSACDNAGWHPGTSLSQSGERGNARPTCHAAPCLVSLACCDDVMWSPASEILRFKLFAGFSCTTLACWFLGRLLKFKHHNTTTTG